ncbi:UDP-N-acetylmuramoyl-L-alanine--D-glutamate ligase [Saccharicrinis sp. FJH54]|uniref:UDP-N-acetylmuramoyl-L-alanine--D-glutamate ligase n=1 Tax=Saccharicrinis sp. FJH54 TaxID=3344665 RepID=UPI0035D47D19
MSNKRLVILGAGESGAGTAVLGKLKGYDVFVSDMGAVSDKYKHLLNQHQIAFEEKQHSEALILNADLVMKSPGIPEKAPIIKKIRENNIKVVSEIEFASWYCSAKLVCVTGSNGKTTTTSLIYDIFKKAGLNVGLAGNIGDSFALQVALKSYDVYVLELSSFQLDDIEKFKPDVAILTNITPDHLDRYDYKFENYIKSKFRITMNQTDNDVFIYNLDDPVTTEWLDRIGLKGKPVPFSLDKALKKDGGWEAGEDITLKYQDKILNMKRTSLGIKGRHNVSNSLAAGLSAMVMNIRNEAIREALSDFKGVEHRLERVSAVRGIEFINDSKATNVNSTWYALECLNTPVVWIAGGTDKGNNYAELLNLVKGKVRALVCIGVDNSKLKDQFGDIVNTIVEAETMEEAVKTSYFLAKKGDTVLLSPACASFDRFKNYEDRGNQFKQQVRKL